MDFCVESTSGIPEDRRGGLLQARTKLARENDEGCVEYKWRLTNVTPQRLQHLVTQMKFRVMEGHGQCVYEIGVMDDGTERGLRPEEYRGTLDTIKRMASCLGFEVNIIYEKKVPPTWVKEKKRSPHRETGADSELKKLPSHEEVGPTTTSPTSSCTDTKKEHCKDSRQQSVAVTGENETDPLSSATNILLEEKKEKQQEERRKENEEKEKEEYLICAEIQVRKPDHTALQDLRIAVCGPADGGKSTLVGVLAHGSLDDGEGSVRQSVFNHRHELSTGHTSSVGEKVIGFDEYGNPVNYDASSIGATANDDLYFVSSSHQTIAERSVKLVTLLDLAGHEKYAKTTLFTMTSQVPGYAIIVGTYTQPVESLIPFVELCLALDIQFFVTLTKSDRVTVAQKLKYWEELDEALTSVFRHLGGDEQFWAGNGNGHGISPTGAFEKDGVFAGGSSSYPKNDSFAIALAKVNTPTATSARAQQAHEQQQQRSSQQQHVCAGAGTRDGGVLGNSFPQEGGEANTQTKKRSPTTPQIPYRNILLVSNEERALSSLEALRSKEGVKRSANCPSLPSSAAAQRPMKEPHAAVSHHFDPNATVPLPSQEEDTTDSLEDKPTPLIQQQEQATPLPWAQDPAATSPSSSSSVYYQQQQQRFCIPVFSLSCVTGENISRLVAFLYSLPVPPPPAERRSPSPVPMKVYSYPPPPPTASTSDTQLSERSTTNSPPLIAVASPPNHPPTWQHASTGTSIVSTAAATTSPTTHAAGGSSVPNMVMYKGNKGAPIGGISPPPPTLPIEESDTLVLIENVFKGIVDAPGLIVRGTIYRGKVRVGTRMLVGPTKHGTFLPTIIASMHVQGQETRSAIAGTMVAIALQSLPPPVAATTSPHNAGRGEGPTVAGRATVGAQANNNTGEGLESTNNKAKEPSHSHHFPRTVAELDWDRKGLVVISPGAFAQCSWEFEAEVTSLSCTGDVQQQQQQLVGGSCDKCSGSSCVGQSSSCPAGNTCGNISTSGGGGLLQLQHEPVVHCRNIRQVARVIRVEELPSSYSAAAGAAGVTASEGDTTGTKFPTAGSSNNIHTMLGSSEALPPAPCEEEEEKRKTRTKTSETESFSKNRRSRGDEGWIEATRKLDEYDEADLNLHSGVDVGPIPSSIKGANHVCGVPTSGGSGAGTTSSLSSPPSAPHTGQPISRHFNAEKEEGEKAVSAAPETRASGVAQKEVATEKIMQPQTLKETSENTKNQTDEDKKSSQLTISQDVHAGISPRSYLHHHHHHHRRKQLVTFRFLYHPELLECGSLFLLRTNRMSTKVGTVTAIKPISARSCCCCCCDADTGATNIVVHDSPPMGNTITTSHSLSEAELLKLMKGNSENENGWVPVQQRQQQEQEQEQEKAQQQPSSDCNPIDGCSSMITGASSTVVFVADAGYPTDDAGIATATAAVPTGGLQDSDSEEKRKPSQQQQREAKDRANSQPPQSMYGPEGGAHEEDQFNLFASSGDENGGGGKGGREERRKGGDTSGGSKQRKEKGKQKASNRKRVFQAW